MPIYEFVCQGCSHEFEELILGQARGIKCPKCHKARVKRQMSVFGFKSAGSLAGSGGGCSSCSTPSKCSVCH